MLNRVDHLVYAAPNLQEAIEKVESLFKIKSSPGGKHPAYGTANVLFSLGPETYLEIVGPDPDIAASARPSLFSINKIAAPKLVTWAAKEANLEKRLTLLKKEQISFGDIYPGERAKPDGTILSWRFTNPLQVIGDGIIPFLIDWGATVNPAKTAKLGCRLLDLKLEHPDARILQPIINTLGLDMTIKKAPNPAIIAIIKTPFGEIALS